MDQSAAPSAKKTSRSSNCKITVHAAIIFSRPHCRLTNAVFGCFAFNYQPRVSRKVCASSHLIRLIKAQVPIDWSAARVQLPQDACHHICAKTDTNAAAGGTLLQSTDGDARIFTPARGFTGFSSKYGPRQPVSRKCRQG